MIVGYAGGQKEWPTYRSIKDSTEAVRVIYDPSLISYEDILRTFFHQHSPSSPAYSVQYRSAILVHSEEQRAEAQKLIGALSKRSKVYTSVEDATPFYRAEEYHQKYMEKNRR